MNSPSLSAWLPSYGLQRITLHTFRIIDLKRADTAMLPRWCRGLMIGDGRHVWVGFTRIRKAALMEKLVWVKHGFRAVSRVYRRHEFLAKTRCMRKFSQLLQSLCLAKFCPSAL